MSLIRNTPITGPKAWRGADLAADTSWLVTLTAAEIGRASCRERVYHPV